MSVQLYKKVTLIYYCLNVKVVFPCVCVQVHARAQPAASEVVWQRERAGGAGPISGGAGGPASGQPAWAAQRVQRKAGSDLRHPAWAQLYSCGEQNAKRKTIGYNVES